MNQNGSNRQSALFLLPWSKYTCKGLGVVEHPESDENTPSQCTRTWFTICCVELLDHGWHHPVSVLLCFFRNMANRKGAQRPSHLQLCHPEPLVGIRILVHEHRAGSEFRHGGLFRA